MNQKAERITGAFCHSQIFLEGFPPRNWLEEPMVLPCSIAVLLLGRKTLLLLSLC